MKVCSFHPYGRVLHTLLVQVLALHFQVVNLTSSKINKVSELIKYASSRYISSSSIVDFKPKFM
jgi:hypothetical protein